jgi:hypothetical protein
MDYAHVTEDNQIRSPQGRQHIDDFSSDSWSEMTRLQKVPNMQERRWLIHNRDFLLTDYYSLYWMERKGASVRANVSDRANDIKQTCQSKVLDRAVSFSSVGTYMCQIHKPAQNE